MTRREGIIAALLAPLAEAQTKESDATRLWFSESKSPSAFTLSLPHNAPGSPCITVTALGRTVTLTTAEVMDALEGK